MRKPGTLVALYGVALLVAGTVLSQTPPPVCAKDAAGCSLSTGRPMRGTCSQGEEYECYECYYSNGSGEWVCYENIDGSIKYCTRDGGGGGPRVY